MSELISEALYAETFVNPTFEEACDLVQVGVNTRHLEIRCDVISDVNGKSVPIPDRGIILDPYEAYEYDSHLAPSSREPRLIETLWYTMTGYDEHTKVEVTLARKEKSELRTNDKGETTGIHFINPKSRKKHLFEKIINGIIQEDANGQMTLTRTEVDGSAIQIPWNAEVFKTAGALCDEEKQRKVAEMARIMVTSNEVLVFKPQKKIR